MHILVVEDEPRLAQLLKRALEHDSHDVEIALDGLDGLHKAESGSFEVIVLDILLPRLNGIEVCRRLRAGGVHTPVLMLTARAAVYQRVEGLDAGADDYLTKPFALAELLARIRALERRLGPATAEVIHVGDLTLDPGRRQVYRQATPVELTRKEFDLLEYLMRHPNQVLSRAQIMDQVWGYEFSTLTNVVDIYIHYLRNKIEKGFGEKLIRTVRGVGYSITDGA